MKNILCVLILCAFVVKISALGYSVRMIHDGPNCLPEHKIIHISFEVYFHNVFNGQNRRGNIFEFNYFFFFILG